MNIQQTREGKISTILRALFTAQKKSARSEVTPEWKKAFTDNHQVKD